jgi:hypothetical protein
VFNTDWDAPVQTPVVIADGAARPVTWWCNDRFDAAVVAVAQDQAGVAEKMREGLAGDDDVVAVARPAVADRDDAASVGADDDLGVAAASIVLAVIGAAVGCEHGGQERDQVVDDAVDR